MHTFHFTYELELTATALHPVSLISAQGYWWHTATGLQRRKRKVSLPRQLLLGPPDKAETPLLPEVKMNFWRLMCKASSFLLLQPHTLFPMSDLLWEVSQKARLDDGKASSGRKQIFLQQTALHSSSGLVQVFCHDPAETPPGTPLPSPPSPKQPSNSNSKKRMTAEDTAIWSSQCFHLRQEYVFPKPCQSLEAQKWDKPNKNISSCENMGLPKDFWTVTAAYGCFLLLSLSSDPRGWIPSGWVSCHHVVCAVQCEVTASLCCRLNREGTLSVQTRGTTHPQLYYSVKLGIKEQNGKFGRKSYQLKNCW